MDHLLCINTNSFPADSEQLAVELFGDALQGVLELFIEDNDRVIFYLDALKGLCLHELELCEGFTYNDFLTYLEAQSEFDLLSVLLEIEDKSPALDFFNDNELDEIGNFTYFLPNQGIYQFSDVFSISDHLSAKLLSLNTSPEWNNHQLEFNKTQNGEYNHNTCIIDNISTKAHGSLLYEIYNSLQLNTACSTALISNEVLKWFSELNIENKNIVYKKLSYCNERNFRGNEPLFKSIVGTPGLWEVRFSAFSGGAIRMLYRTYNDKNILLVGFIKKSDNEGYKQNIQQAEDIFIKTYAV